ncbi:MAG: hypothetical protein MPEBLZ_04383 [Candidatus Methanoperedens nitroreducens]|uniref:Uncharacterized protein n=1 Tax=Candidatus Methanoperedens nitratireducens TaxID=1392998 RepID=A0A0P8DUI9_9EURY|nr:MAG: hypothetical protein F9K14_03235 [Candidatus Methanoperedens sp.]KPQ41069.1 MAG: hypothetical protein MPEBLZ_04383 [Candidatus Methanoperedens sp. BLZ1]MBZ0175245.1 hypothetical protein [Candidatus Methanoperedens nitroreducens]MCX9076518.1 hypothetical protein [Candidatus Methanoperedens sp.]
MCLESCFECEDPCWSVYNDLPGFSGMPAAESKNPVIVAGPPCHSEPLGKQVFERSDDAQPAGRMLRDNKNASVPEDAKSSSGILTYEKPWYAVGD